MTDYASDLASHALATSIATFRSQKSLGDRALAQLDDAAVGWTPEPENNSVAVIVKHVSGNMISRWTDFLTSDGEKPWRERDGEFVDDVGSLERLKELWELGWSALFGALEALRPDDLLRTVYIRGQAHTALEAINRQISHYGYHVGQIVYVAKAYKSAGWNTLSIAKGQSRSFNEEMKRS
ncbi:DUF1572 family protein [Cohnella suwonensis]|uniref:DUF1572 family protein n=1 Tax=Cohnella suwonensis TaxID=696072 RepID=A0ABW0M0T4_9BACL